MFFIISFHNTVIVIKKALIHLLAPLFCLKPELKLYFSQDAKNNFNQQMQNTNYTIKTQIEYDNSIDEDINSFIERMHNFNIKGFKYYHMYRDIQISMIRYLVQCSYNELDKKQIVDFSKDFSIKSSEEKKMSIEKWDDGEYIKLRDLGSGSSSIVSLMFQIEDKRLYAIKIQNYFNLNDERKDYPKREHNNYLRLNYPLLPKIYGVYKCDEKYYLKIQFINGQTLDKLDKSKLVFNDKLFIILQLILIINYFHKKDFVYRDLKPNNVIVDENKTVFVIDFDRMVSINDDNTKYTVGFGDFTAPEVNYGKISPENDVYSLGKMIEYILDKDELKYDFKKLTYEDPSKRPSISNLLNDICCNYKSNIDNLPIKNTPEILNTKCFNENPNIRQMQYDRGEFYSGDQYNTQFIKRFIHNLTLSANQNNPHILFFLGMIYSQGEYVTQDIKKSIHYYTLAANQNHLQAQFFLGMIYLEGQLVTRDINKSIYYFTLAANQNHPEAQYNLGLIYYGGQYVTRDINKSIYYYTLAANQNYPQAQFNLGLVYYLGQYIARDINKSIYYYTLAANQNHPQAQFNLGLIYSEGQYITRDISKSIHYFTLAANQNIPQAQYNLGVIYSKGEYITRDIKKSIHYYTLAANQNYPEAHFNLGVIYLEGQYITRDINKSIHYFTLAANQNYSLAQFYLGLIYLEGQYITRDINRSIYYLTLAANQNYPQAQFNLGLFYMTANMSREISTNRFIILH